MITLKTLGQVHDITKYVNRPYKRNEGIVGLLDTAELTIPSIDKDALQGIDMSFRLPINSLVEIQTLEGLKQRYIESSEVKNAGNNTYTHVIQLTELKKILDDRPLPDNTTTQPADINVSYVSETSSIVPEKYVGDVPAYRNPVKFNVSQVSNDTDIINNRVVKVDGTYQVNFSITMGRLTGILAPQLYNLTVELYSGENTVLHSQDFGSFGSIGWAKVGTLSFNTDVYLTANTGIRARVVMRGQATAPSPTGSGYVPVIVNVTSGFMTIDKVEEVESSPIYMDEVVDKLLGMVNVSSQPEFELDTSSRSRLATILAYDDAITEVTLRNALERVASYVGARLYLNIVDSKKIVSFVFFEDMSKGEYVEYSDDDIVIKQVSNDYVSGLSLQNNNVIRDNTLIELSSVRSVNNDTAQITTDNTATHTKHSQDIIYKFEVKGVEIKDTNGNVVLNADDYLDITSNVIEKSYYDTLDKYANYDNRLINNQNNHLYYVRGDNTIYGMSFVGSQFDTFIPASTNRAIYETIATVIQRRDTLITIPKYNDKGLTGDMQLEFRITYQPMSQSHAYIYKDDQRGFQEKIIKRINADDRVNNADFLGNYVRTKVNSLGGTEKGGKHIGYNQDTLLNLGSVSSDNSRLVGYTAFDYDDFIEYYPTEVKDYVFQSHYIGIDSDRKLFHIPKDEYVKRVDKSLNIIYLGKETIPMNNSAIVPSMFMKFLENNNNYITAPKTALLTFDDKNITALPDIGATANTIEWYLEMQDNYSAGNKRAKVPDQENAYYQYGVSYGNLFGRVLNVNVIFKEKQLDSLISKNLLPEGNQTEGLEYTNFLYKVRKDAREQYALSVQTAILSEDVDVQVYNGIGKYNLMSNHVKHDISLAILHYIPNRDDKYIDLGRITSHINNAVVSDTSVKVNLNQSGIGYAFYHRDTGELILSVKNALYGDNFIYYKGESLNFLKGAIFNFTISLMPNIKYSSNKASFSLKLGATIDFDKVYAEGQNYELDIGLIPNLVYSKNVRSFSLNLGATVEIDEVYAEGKDYELDIGLIPNVKYSSNKVSFSLNMGATVNFDEDYAIGKDYELDIGLIPNVKRTSNKASFSLKLGATVGIDGVYEEGKNYELDISLVPNLVYSKNVKSFSLNLGATVEVDKTTSKNFNLNVGLIPSIRYSSRKQSYNLNLGAEVAYNGKSNTTFDPPIVKLSKRTSGSNILFDARMENDNNINYQVEYEIDLSGNVISGGIINSGGYMLVSAFKTSSANTNVTTRFRARFRNSLGNVTAWASQTITHTPTTSGKWEYKGVSTMPFCSDPGYNMIGDTCQVIGETRVVSGHSIGMSSTCVELICK